MSQTRANPAFEANLREKPHRRLNFTLELVRMFRLYFLPALLLVISVLLCLVTYFAIFLSLAASMVIVLIMFIKAPRSTQQRLRSFPPSPSKHSAIALLVAPFIAVALATIPMLLG